MTPRFGPAVLRALVAYDEARRGLAGDNWRDALNDALNRLDDALDDALGADGAAHPVPVGDEGERTPMPHRFGSPL